MKRSKDTDLIFSRQDVDRLIVGLEEQIAKRDAYIATLEARIVELEKALKVPTKTSKNSSSRPSSDYKSNKSDEHDSQKKKRRNGHGKGGRGLHDTPNQVFEMKLTTCPDCMGSLEEDTQALHTTYDRVELPEVQSVVTCVHLYKCRYAKCGFVGICPAPVGYEPGSPFTLSVAQELID